MQNENSKINNLKFEDLDRGGNQIVRMVYNKNNRSEYAVIHYEGKHEILHATPLVTLSESKLDRGTMDPLDMKDEDITIYPLTPEDEEIVDILVKKAKNDLNEQRLKHIAAIEEIGVIKHKFETLQKVKIN